MNVPSPSRKERLRQYLADRKAAAARSPELFRRSILLDANDRLPFSRTLQPWQQRDFEACDPAWLLAAGRAKPNDSDPPIRRRAYLERPRGHSKTTDTAVLLAYVLYAAATGVNGLAAAADLQQAALIHAALRRLCAANPSLLDAIVLTENAARNRETGSLLKVISSDVRGSWGELPDFVICDELCHWNSPDLWHSLLSSAAKRPRSVVVVLSNAGFGRGWQWDVREAARTDEAWHFSSLKGPHAPWITAESLAEQQRLLPPPVFARLWLNEWQHSDGEFVTLAETIACRDESLVEIEQGENRFSYVASIDYAEKRDRTVGCVCHREGDTIFVDRMDVVRPTVTRPTPVQWVIDWMHRIAANFPDVQFVLDEYQLAVAIQSLSACYAVKRFEFKGGEGNHRIAMVLRQLITERRVRWQVGCGAVIGESGEDDSLESELASLIVRQSGNGRIRFDHLADGRHHDDRAFALAVACDELMHVPAGGDEMIVTPPGSQGMFQRLF